MGEWLGKFEMGTSVDDFLATPNAVNPLPSVIGENGIKIGEFDIGVDWTITHYLDEGLVVWGEAPILDTVPRSSVKPRRFMAAEKAGQLTDVKRWLDPDEYWNRKTEDIVSAAIEDDGMEEAEQLAVRAIAPYAVQFEPLDALQEALDGERILNPRAAISELLTIAEDHAADGDWKIAGAIRDIGLINTVREDGNTAINFASMMGWKHGVDSTDSLCCTVTNFSPQTFRDYEQFSRGKNDWAALKVSAVILNTMFSAPFHRAIEHTVSTQPDSEEVKKLERVYRTTVVETKTNIYYMQSRIDRFTHDRGLPDMDLLPAIETFSGQSLRDLYN